MTARHRLIDWLLLLALVAMWSSAFATTRLAVETVAPSWVVAIRVVMAALILAPLVLVAGRALPRRGRIWAWFLALAVMGNALPFTLISWGQQHIDSGLAAILVAMMPLGTAVIAHWALPNEKLSWAKVAGFVLGFAGVVVLIGPDALSALGGTSVELLGQLAVLGGALCYSTNAVLARLAPATDTVTKAVGTLIMGSCIMLPLASLGGSPMLAAAGATALLSILALAVFPTALATIVYFKLIDRAGPSFLALTNYIIPPVAVAIGWAFLDEQLEPRALGAMVLILAGLALAEQARIRAARGM